jgi:hypothetical protein
MVKEEKERQLMETKRMLAELDRGQDRTKARRPSRLYVRSNRD